jgi:hypothetical protein
MSVHRDEHDITVMMQHQYRRDGVVATFSIQARRKVSLGGASQSNLVFVVVSSSHHDRKSFFRRRYVLYRQSFRL